MIKICYCSKTGFSKQYAEIIERETGLEAVDVKNLHLTDKDSQIFYVASVMAGTIRGLKKALKNYNILGVLAVGMDDRIADYAKILKTDNSISAPVFYAQGGTDLGKLKGISKLVLKMVLTSKAKKQNQDPNEQKRLIANALLPKNFVKKENIDNFISLVQSAKAIH